MNPTDGKTKVGRMYEKTSAAGNKYFQGRQGDYLLVMFPGETMPDGTPSWDVYRQYLPKVPKQQTAAAPIVPPPGPGLRTQRPQRPAASTGGAGSKKAIKGRNAAGGSGKPVQRTRWPDGKFPVPTLGAATAPNAGGSAADFGDMPNDSLADLIGAP